MKKSFYIFALGAFGIVTTEFSIIGILPALIKHFNVSVSIAGWLLSGFALTVAVGGPFMNVFLNKLNRKTVMCLALAVFLVSNLISSVAPNFTILMIARIIAALFHPVFWAVALTAASKQAGPKDAPKAIAVVMGGLSLASVLGVPLSTYVADLFDWHASFYLSAAINLVALLSMSFFVPSMPVPKVAAHQNNQIKVLSRVDIWVKMLTSVIIMSGMFASFGYLGLYLDKVGHLNGAQISIMLLVFGGSGLIGNWLTGLALSKNVPLTNRIFLVLLVTMHVLVYFFGGMFAPMVVILSLWGLIHTGGFLTANLHITHGVHGSGLDFLNGLIASIFNAGITLGTLFGGFVVAQYGIHNVVWMAVILLMMAFCLTFVNIPVKEKKGEKFAETLGEPSPHLESGF